MWSSSSHSGVLIFLAFLASSRGVLAQSCSATLPCPLNVCCSQYGFCGTTPAFCGSAVVAEPSCTGTSSNARTIGYYEGWAPSRKCDNITPEQINASAFTHLNYGFALIDPVSFSVAPPSINDSALFQRIANLKITNPALKVWIAVGGSSMNDAGQPTQNTFSKLVASTSSQKSFFASLLIFMSTFGFDGVDLDWEYPVAPERGGNSADFANYVSFLKNLKAALTASGHDYGLSVAIPASYYYLQNFDIVKMEPVVDWFNFMSYDLHGTWDSPAVVGAHTNLTEIAEGMKLLWRNGVNPAKVNLGLAFYGRSFTLSNSACAITGCPFSAGGTPGQCTGVSGMLSSAEINRLIAAGGVTVTANQAAAVQIATWGPNQWASFDNAATFAQKISWANSRCLGGIMVYATSLDSVSGAAAAGLSQSIIRPKNVALGSSSDNIGCVVTGCSSKPTCPIGKSAVQQSNGTLQNVHVVSCPASQTRTFCCPSSDLPTCRWVGNGRLCTNNQCSTSEIQLSTDTTGCWFNHKTLCCSKTPSQLQTGNCAWQNGCTTSSTCSDGSNPLYSSPSLGGTGATKCWAGMNKFCCTQPPSYSTCSKPTGRLAGFSGGGICPYNQIQLFNDPGGYLGGNSPVCCS